jgi:hypothetical protein
MVARAKGTAKVTATAPHRGSEPAGILTGDFG